MTISFFEDIFPYEKFPVEHLCHQQLRDSSLNYVAVPWTQILNCHWLDFPGRKSREYYFVTLRNQTITQENNFTVCQHDSYMQLIDLFKYLKITTVFTPLHDRRNVVDGINFIPIAFTNSFEFEEREKDIPFSFVGASTTHPIRELMRRRIVGDNIIYRNAYHVGGDIFEVKQKEEAEYKSILERSKFSLCPRGSSPSSVRFWESLAAQAIPILISDEWVLPDWDWENTIVKIPEASIQNSDYSTILEMVESISNDRYMELKTNCAKAYETFKKENFGSYITSKL